MINEEQVTNTQEDSIRKPSISPLVLGILAFSGLMVAVLGYVFAIPGLIISMRDRKKPNSKYGKIGMILSAVALVLTIGNSILAIISITV
jgi:amino acid permease